MKIPSSCLSEVKLTAAVITSSSVCTMTGIFLEPGDFRTRFSSLSVSCRTLGGHMSILVTTTKTGTLRASARPRCSVVEGRRGGSRVRKTELL